MHQRSLYRDARLLDFDALATSVPALRPHVSHSSSKAPLIDYDDPEAMRQLTYALLQRDFGLTLVLPEDRLCPGTWQRRLDYALWITDVAADGWTSPLKRGMDIGTGASAIYALLLARLHDDLIMLATETDEHSFDAASANVIRNDLKNRVTVEFVGASDPLRPSGNEEYDFSLCNPPFYSSADEIELLKAGKNLPPSAACTGSPSEMITPGGEVAFVSRMIRDGQTGRVRWQSSLLGKLTSMSKIVAELKRLEIDNYAVTEMQQGRTRRWAIAWSHSAHRISDYVARSPAPALAKLLPQSNTSTTRLMESVAEVQKRLQVLFAESGIVATPLGDSCYDIEARSESWSRRERRKRARNSDGPAAGDEMIMRCRLELVSVDLGTRMECFWLYGRSRVIWQGFLSHLRRGVQVDAPS